MSPADLGWQKRWRFSHITFILCRPRAAVSWNGPWWLLEALQGPVLGKESLFSLPLHRSCLRLYNPFRLQGRDKGWGRQEGKPKTRDHTLSPAQPQGLNPLNSEVIAEIRHLLTSRTLKPRCAMAQACRDSSANKPSDGFSRLGD